MPLLCRHRVFPNLFFGQRIDFMSDTIDLLIERMFVGPVWPASLLVGLLVIYTLVAIIGLIDLDWGLPDADVDMDLDLDLDFHQLDFDLVHGIGAASLRWVNLGRIPMVIWGGVFTMLFWSVSYGLWHNFEYLRYQPDLWTSAILSVRNFVIATLATKLITAPLVKHFLPLPQYDAGRLIGGTCEVISLEVTPDHGQGRFRTGAAPLLLNIRSIGPVHQKGDEVRIVSFDATRRVYQIDSMIPTT